MSRTNTRSNERFAETSAVPGTGISVAGQRNIGNTFIVDGLSANDDAADLAGTYYSEEVIREFQVVTSGGVAEFGRASAGIINIVTQSGTNQPRGRAYGFFRNDELDAKNPLATQEDPLSQNQYRPHLRRTDRAGPDILVRQRRAHAAGQDRYRHRSRRPTSTRSTRGSTRTGIRRTEDRDRRFPTGYDTTNVFGAGRS